MEAVGIHRIALIDCCVDTAATTMSASESQQWYIEEIPAIEQDEESSYVECDRPVSVESEAAGTAPEAFISLDTGTATMLDIPQSKVEVMVRTKEGLLAVRVLLCHLSTFQAVPSTAYEVLGGLTGGYSTCFPRYTCHVLVDCCSITCWKPCGPTSSICRYSRGVVYDTYQGTTLHEVPVMIRRYIFMYIVSYPLSITQHGLIRSHIQQ